MATPFKHPRNGVYYIRRAIPEDLREVLGKAEYKKSLGTKDPLEAKKLFPVALHESEAVFRRARECRATVDALNDEQIREAGEAWAAHTLGEDEEMRLEGLDDKAYAKMQETFDIVLPALKAVNSLPTVTPFSRPIVTPFSRPIVTPLGRPEWAYPRSA